MINKKNEIRQRMHRLKIFEKDIKEIFIHASGSGGQNINKVATCVVLTHIPTGISVKCQQERTQGMNRYRARCGLVDKIEKQQKKVQLEKVQTREKKKRQNRKRPRALKEKILQAKHKQSEKKSSRNKINSLIRGEDI